MYCRSACVQLTKVDTIQGLRRAIRRNWLDAMRSKDGHDDWPTSRISQKQFACLDAGTIDPGAMLGQRIPCEIDLQRAVSRKSTALLCSINRAAVRRIGCVVIRRALGLYCHRR